MMDATYTDGLMIVHDGDVLFEHYGGLMQAHRHASADVGLQVADVDAGRRARRRGSSTLPDSFPTTSTACAARRGRAARCSTCSTCAPARRFDEDDYDNPDSDGRLIEQVSGYTSRLRSDIPTDTYQWIAQLPNASRHGGPFQYRSILPDVLAWVMCEATGQTFPELFSQHIWSQLAGHDADIIVDAAGFPVVEGGICTTLEDLARFGLMCLQRGQYAGRQIVPDEWMHRPTTRSQELVDAFVLPRQSGRQGPNACYHDYWWVYDSVAGIYCGLGINGQVLMIHHPVEHGDRQVLDMARPDGLRACRPDRRRPAGVVPFALVLHLRQ